MIPKSEATWKIIQLVSDLEMLTILYLKGDIFESIVLLGIIKRLSLGVFDKCNLYTYFGL